jgi:hypothetical protein
MKVVIIKSIETKKEFVGYESDYTLSPLSYKGDDEIYKTVIENIDYEEINEEEILKNDLETYEIFKSNILKIFIPKELLEKCEISSSDIYDFVENQLFQKVEIRDGYNVIGYEKVPKDELDKRSDIKEFYPIYYREATEEELREIRNNL